VTSQRFLDVDSHKHVGPHLRRFAGQWQCVGWRQVRRPEYAWLVAITHCPYELVLGTGKTPHEAHSNWSLNRS
jgi:hypothetical protein